LLFKEKTMAQHKIREDKTQLKVKAGKIHTAKGKKKFTKKMPRKR
jgi:hypothetical protein